jgi:hypothetical protein
LHGRPADLGHGGAPVQDENSIEPVEFVRAACETGNARRDADERPAPSLLRPLRRRTALRRRQDAALALLRFGDADEVLIDGVGQKAPERCVVATQDDDMTVPLVAQPLGLEAGDSLRV